MNELERLAKFIYEIKYDDIPSSVVEAGKLCVLDSFAAAAGASRDELAVNIAGEYKSYYTDVNDVDIWGMGMKAPMIQGAFINSLMGHRLELDDVHTKSKTHIGTVVVPVALCMAQHSGASGKEFLEAVICGYEVMSRIGMAFGVSSHRNKGWHVTSTAGTFGACAAASKLLKLDEEKTAHALGMAGTQSFGLWAFLEDSASSKILHPARAASSGMESAILAKAGMTGPRGILTAKDGGLLKAMSDECDLSMIDRDLGVVYEIKNVDNKPYPCCRSTHCAIDSALYLREKYDIDVSLIEEIEVSTYLVGYKQCGLTEGSLNPRTPTEAKFSTPYTVAVALAKGNITLDDFKAENINTENIKKILKKVRVQSDDTFTERYPEHWGCRTRIQMKNGDVFETEIRDAFGSVYNPVSAEKIYGKAAPLLKDAYGSRTDEIINTVLNIEKIDDLNTINL